MTKGTELHDPEGEVLLSAYLDGELEPEERRQVEAHLAGCGRCRELLFDLRRVKSLVGELPLEAPPRPVTVGYRPLRRLPELAALAALVAGLLLLGADLLIARTPASVMAPAVPAAPAADRQLARPETGPAERPLARLPGPLGVAGAGLAATGGLGFIGLKLGRRRAGLFLGALVVAGIPPLGCVGAGGGAGNAGPPVPPGAEQTVAAVRADAARRSGLSPSQVRVLGVEEVDWPDTSLGCPEPGKFYAQVITPGYKITVRAGDTDYEYHADRTGRFVLCVRGQPSAR